MSTVERGAEVLGYTGVVASWQRFTQDAKPRYQPYVVLQSMGGMSESGFEPAQSIAIQSKEGLLTLKKVVEEALKYDI